MVTLFVWIVGMLAAVLFLRIEYYISGEEANPVLWLFIPIWPAVLVAIPIFMILKGIDLIVKRIVTGEW